MAAQGVAHQNMIALSFRREYKPQLQAQSDFDRYMEIMIDASFYFEGFARYEL